MREKKAWAGRVAVALVLALAALVALCLWLAEQRQAGQAREAELAAKLEEGQAELEALQTSLDDRQAQLEEAQDTIALLETYSYVTPEGTAPEYTQLYPEMYAADWEGETITGGKTVCLTFDDGPSDNTDKVLEILDQYGVKATFFVVGKTSEANQQRMRDIVAAGHTLAVHSWSHDYKKIYASVEAYLEDFHQMYEWIYEVTGTYPQVFRFPGGSINGYDRGVYQEIIAEMTRRGFVYFDWNASAQDATAKPLDPSVIVSNCLQGVGKDLVVVLSHDSAARTTTVEALPAVIEGYQAAGYSFAALTPGVTPVIMDYKVEK
jgi:peptidoglycan/xylan/chitin deacetylase (PgdA/CDA1 family)